MSEKSSQPLLVLLIVGALAFGLGFVIGKLYEENQSLKKGVQPAAVEVPPADDAAAGPTQETLNQAKAPSQDDHIRGAAKPKVTLVEYSDFECPFCNRFHPTTSKILADYKDEVALIYRHYPLGFHAKAQVSAETSECVAKVGGNEAFWKFADYIFEKQENGTAMTDALIAESVKAAGADSGKVKTCVDSGEMTQRVKDQEADGQKAGVQGTPGTIIFTKDGAQELIPGALPYEQVKTLVEKYL